MKNFSIKTLLVSVLLFVFAFSANAFPTTVKLLSDPNYTETEGETVVLQTNKGRLEFGMDTQIYNDIERAKKGQCYEFETETESNVEFNKRVDRSGAQSVTKVRCK